MINLTEAIKVRLGITGTFHDELINAYADDVKAYMLSAGISQPIIDSTKSIGLIARGVADLWNYGAGDGKFSEVFYQRMTQLALLSDASEEAIIEGLSSITASEIDECTECLKD